MAYRRKMVLDHCRVFSKLNSKCEAQLSPGIKGSRPCAAVYLAKNLLLILNRISDSIGKSQYSLCLVDARTSLPTLQKQGVQKKSLAIFSQWLPEGYLNYKINLSVL
ncbi:hypothetical protein J6590_015198 [Homalodisca vitripennis]|nr:hypothetical protein J6590_015198 [Homalodisca vitripennis]